MRISPDSFSFFFFFNDTATTEIYTLSLHDALPICWTAAPRATVTCTPIPRTAPRHCTGRWTRWARSEEHTSELQSQSNLVCRLLLEKKKNKIIGLVDDEAVSMVLYPHEHTIKMMIR